MVMEEGVGRISRGGILGGVKKNILMRKWKVCLGNSD
jgi:hypothetical protein